MHMCSKENFDKWEFDGCCILRSGGANSETVSIIQVIAIFEFT